MKTQRLKLPRGWTPWMVGALLLSSTLAAQASTLGLSFETTSSGTQSSGSTADGTTVTGTSTVVPSTKSSSYFYGNTFPAATPIITASGTYGFYDDYAFTVSSSSADSVTTTIDLGSALQISDLEVRLFSLSNYDLFAANGTPDYGTITGEWDATTSGSQATLSAVNLSAGTYVLEIRGDATGTSGGSYAGVLNVTPVPLPTSLPLLLGGLGALALGLQRRREDLVR